ncbi:GNAT family N-acetyltransferase [Actibacterium sp. XHP0104]|uniref:GNAT family N-acetyltransferase n=1 Tax=Actibacterium sp. XHP0104 TaxID=2984335 RepID=UPI0021E8F138|nr:GNAT family N-acetyltransferase [Actibacterium sp. XHP0104]MCV2881662.1 GNAT family N-acetyltransferase [Actibacterium sp. XHP0104]
MSIYDIIDATWPAARFDRIGPWVIRDGQGGGQRVSAATATGPVNADDIATAEAAMRALGQEPLFMVQDGQEDLDAALAQAGYGLHDPVAIYSAPVSEIATQRPPPVSAFDIWPPLHIIEELWAEGKIGPERMAVMQRVAGPKTAVLGRVRDRASGVTFAAIHEKTAMLHALEVTPEQRRQGTAVNILRHAAFWAQENGAETLVALVLQSNEPACTLCTSLGMRVVGHYHYRK